MKQLLSDKCPQPSVLIEFLQGKLEPPVLDDCESHLEQCPQCHETLRGLDSGDTLSEKVTAALNADAPEKNSDSFQIDGLIQQLTSSKFLTRGPAAGQAATSEIMADRAAEVLRCVESDDETLGVLGDYALLRLIGSGSTGVVFQALDRTLQRTVALKVLRPSLGELARERFLAEARSAASIEHANVVTIFQVGQVDRLAFIAMQWLPGQTLEAKLQSGDRLDETQVTDTILKVASGLAAAHQSQLVHRDIKPANLWICDADEQIKILDFGLARINDDNPGLTATGMLAGTPNFMSPEQARGLELDGRSDLFSLGCLMYQLLTGRLPFGASTILGTLQSVQNESPISPSEMNPEVPQHLSDLTMCLLEKQPANRPESANQLIQMLSSPRKDWPILVNQYGDAHQKETEVAPALSEKSKATRGGGRRRWLVTTILLGLGGWGAWLWSPQIIRVMTDQGEVVIESSSEDVEIQVYVDGKPIRVIDTQTQQSFDLKSGKYTFSARSKGDQKNTFEISPNQLIMNRGGKQIVKVTTPKDMSSDTQASENKGSELPYDQPVYDGKTFEHWISVAEHDRDIGKSSNAMIYASATADSTAQKKRLVEVIRKVTRGLTDRYDPYSTPAAFKERCRSAGISINAVDSKMMEDFIKTEIREGTLGSRGFLTFWIYASAGYNGDYVPNNGDGHPSLDKIHAWQAAIQNFGFFALAAASLEQPGNDLLADAFVWLASENGAKEQVVAKANELGFSNELEKLLVNGSIELRRERLPSARVLLGTNEAVYDKYEQDLFDLEVSVRDRSIIYEKFISAPSLSNVLPDKRAATYLRAIKKWSEQTAARRPFYELIKLEPLLSDAFRRDELETTENRQFFSKWFSRSEVDQLFPSKTKPSPSTTDAKQLVKKGLAKPSPSLPPREKPIFKGRQFGQWLGIARRDRDVGTKTNALKACAATVETDAEFESLIKLTRELCRKYGTNVVGADPQADLYYKAFVDVINSLEAKQIVEFIETEIADGTEPSRKFCSNWIAGVTGDFVSEFWLSKIRSVREMTGPIEDALAIHLEKKGNSWILNSIAQSSGPKKFKKSALATVLKQLAADPEQRVLLRYSIVSFLGDDTDIFQLYRNDLLDVNTKPITRMQLCQTLFDSNQNRPLPNQRLQLLFDLAKGVLRQDDQRLEFSQRYFHGTSNVFSKLKAVSVLTSILRELNRVDSQLDAKVKTETMLPQLEELKKAVAEAASDPTREADFGAGNAKRLLADFEYMIKKVSGDTAAEIPDSFLGGGVF